MSYPVDSYGQQDRPAPGCPVTGTGAAEVTPLFGTDFAADPHAVYGRLRGTGARAHPVALEPGVHAILVTSYATAREILLSPDFSKDPRHWTALTNGAVPADSSVRPMMEYRPNALFSDGHEHQTRRQVIDDVLGKVDLYQLRRFVEEAADRLIDDFAPTGRADLMAEYARTLPLRVFNRLFGCPDDIGDRLVEGMSALFDGREPEKSNAIVTQGLLDLVAFKAAQPGSDVTSWILSHPSQAQGEEVIHQIVTLMGAGTEPESNLIGTAALKILADPRFAGHFAGINPPISESINDVLRWDPPLANYGVHYARRTTELHDVVFPTGVPILLSFAAANNDPMEGIAAEQDSTHSAHLAWSAGPHQCPAQRQATSIAYTAIERLFQRLPDLRLAVDESALEWRPGPFHRALKTLPVRFSPRPLDIKRNPQLPDSQEPATGSLLHPATPPPPPVQASPVQKALNVWAKWWRGDN